MGRFKNLIFITTRAFALFFLFIFFDIAKVNSFSMRPTLVSGSRVLYLNKFYTIEKKDILLFKFKNRFLIKRCTGIPGEKMYFSDGSYSLKYKGKKTSLRLRIPTKDLFLKDKQTILNYKNLIERIENKKKFIHKNSIFLDNEKLEFYKFNSDYYFLEGDNKPYSQDSKAFGPISEDSIRGKMLLKF